MSEPEVMEALEVAPSSTLALLEKATIDSQVATAKAFPRSVSRFTKSLRDMVLLNADVAEACIFALPRAGKTIEGASIRFAEMAISAWGNCRVSSRVVAVDEMTVTAQGVFHDLESNSATSDEVRRGILNKSGKRYNADMIVVTGRAASAIARRNAALAGVPRAFWEPIYMEARRVVAGDSQTLANRRAEAMGYLQKFGVTQEMVFATLGVTGIEDVTLDHLVSLRAAARAIREGEATVEEAFVDPSKKAEAPAGAAAPGLEGLKAAVGLPVEPVEPAAPVTPVTPVTPPTPTAPASPKPAQLPPENFWLEARRVEIASEVANSGMNFADQMAEVTRRMVEAAGEYRRMKEEHEGQRGARD